MAKNPGARATIGGEDVFTAPRRFAGRFLLTLVGAVGDTVDQSASGVCLMT